MATWVRFEDGGETGFGVLNDTGDSIDVVEGDMFAKARPAGRAVALSSVRLLAPVESVDEFGRAIKAQLDLRIEADNNRRFTANFAGDADVGFPTLHPELCSRRVLTMGFVHGAKVLEAPAKLGADASRLARIGFRTLLKMVFADGFVHADLHQAADVHLAGIRHRVSPSHLDPGQPSSGQPGLP